VIDVAISGTDAADFQIVLPRGGFEPIPVGDARTSTWGRRRWRTHRST
jgi:hypothetical protein